MKNHNLLSAAILSALFLLVLPARANHLDGLWRNDRLNITLRIESQDEGFRAKRIDQGIWYTYLPQDDYIYTDRFGNAYVVQSDNALVWNEAGSGKRIIFSKIDSRDDDRWGYSNERYDRGYPYKGYDHRPRANARQHNFTDFLNGRWMDTYRHNELEIECFRDGIRVRSEHSGWEKYYPDRYNHSYIDKYGNTIQLIDSDSIRWQSQNGRHDRIYHRAGYRKENCG